MVQVLPAGETETARKRTLKHKETVAEKDARLYGTDPISQHIKKYDVNGDGRFELGEVKQIIEATRLIERPRCQLAGRLDGTLMFAGISSLLM